MENQEPLLAALDQFKTPDQPEPAPTTEPAETPVNTDSINTAASDTTEPGEQTSVTPTTSFDPTAWLNDQSNGAYGNWDEVQAALNKTPEPVTQQLEFPNEVSKILHEALAQGNIEAVADYITKSKIAASVKEASPEDLIKTKWKLEYDLTDAQAQRDFDRQFSVDELMEPEDLEIEKKKVARKIANEAASAKQFFQQYEQEIKLPSLAPAVQASTAPMVDLESAEAKQALQFARQLNQTLPTDFSNTPFEFNDPNANINLKGQVVIPQDKLQQIKTQLSGHEEKAILSRWIEQDGSVNEDRVAYDLYVLTHLPDILKATAADAYHQTRIQVLKQNRNYQEPGPTPAGDPQPSEAEQMVSWFNKTFHVPA